MSLKLSMPYDLFQARIFASSMTPIPAMRTLQTHLLDASPKTTTDILRALHHQYTTHQRFDDIPGSTFAYTYRSAAAAQRQRLSSYSKVSFTRCGSSPTRISGKSLMPCKLLWISNIEKEGGQRGFDPRVWQEAVSM